MQKWFYSILKEIVHKYNLKNKIVNTHFARFRLKQMNYSMQQKKINRVNLTFFNNITFSFSLAKSVN